MKRYDQGMYLVRGDVLCENIEEAQAALGRPVDAQEAASGTMAYRILEKHNSAPSMENLQIRFDKLTSHDITYVGIIQTARASGLEKFPMPYVLTNCHNSLCAVGGTINEDDHMFGLTSAKRYGGVYVPAHQAVIHQYAREMLARCGDMILGSDSHTRYGALGTMAMGEGGPELVKQLLNKTYDIKMPEVVGIYLTGEPGYGVGPQDVALALIAETFPDGYVNNRVLEFVGPGVAALSADFRIGIDVMTTETTCLSSIWQTDEKIKEFYETHGRGGDYSELKPHEVAYYDRMLEIDLSQIKPMIAMPFHPSNAFTIEEVNRNLPDILHRVEEAAKVSLGADTPFSLSDKIRDGKLLVDQGIVAGCAGGGFENLCAVADILKGRSIGCDEFAMSVYPASTPIYMDLAKKGKLADMIAAGAVVKTAFCGPCFGAGDTPANGDLSIRHTTRNFPNREGSKLQQGQIASVALMDARSIAATAVNGGILTPADVLDVQYKEEKYFFDESIYKNRIFDSHGQADPSVEVRFGPNIKDWPAMSPLPDNLILKIVSKIEDPVTTTDELIPSGETSSYRSNPLGLAEFTLSRKDPAYVGEAKKVQKAQKALEAGEDPVAALPEIESVWKKITEAFPGVTWDKAGVGSTIFAVKPGDGSAREQAASCQKVLGGWANIAHEYATKRYRSNLMNWGMLPLLIDASSVPFEKGDYVFLPDVRRALAAEKTAMTGYIVGEDGLKEIRFTTGAMTDTEREILLKGCLINYYRG